MNKIPFDKDLYTKNVHVDKIKPGDILAHDVYLKSGLLVANAGVALTDFQVERLKQLNNKVVTLDLRQIFRQGVQVSKKIFRDAAEGKPLKITEVQDFVKPFEEETFREKNIIKLLMNMQSTDEYTFQHTINIGVLVMVIGRWLGLEDERLHNLLLAGTLHDIGKSKIPLNILNKPGPLTKDEFNVIKNHTIYGYEIVRASSEFNLEIKNAVLQHHERIDGQGYPYGIKGDKIGLFAKIIAVADVYHAMTTTRVYKHKQNPYEVLEHLYKNLDSLDTEIALMFLEKMLCSLQTHKVRLSNGMLGDVVYLDKTQISKPLVRVEGDRFIDLKKKDVSIMEIVYED